MKKTTKLLTLLLVLLLALSLLTVAACKRPTEETDDDDTTEEEVASSLLISNGLFATASSSTTDKTEYVKDTVSGWTRTAAATSTSSSTASFVGGVVDLSDTETFAKAGETFRPATESAAAGIDNPGKAVESDEDGNALVLGLPTTAGSFYYKESSSVTLEANKYYKLSFSVYTDIVEGPGAYVVANASGEVIRFEAINTGKTWKTYTAYIQANNFENRTMTVELWIGYGSKYTGYSANGTNGDDNLNTMLTKGVVFFDDVTLTVDEKGEGYASAEASEFVKTASLYYPDQGFTTVGSYSYTTTSYSTDKYFYGAKQGYSANYTGVLGKVDLEDSTDFPSTSTYGATSIGGTVGIVNIDKIYGTYNDEEINVLEKLITSISGVPTKDALWNGRETKPAETSALMIYHPNGAVSGYGMQSNYKYLIESNKYYTISVWVYMFAPEYNGTEPDKVDEVAAPAGERPETAGEEQTAWDNAKEAYDKYTTYLEEKQAYEDAKKAYDDAKANAYATFKITGVSVGDSDELVTKSSTTKGTWEQISFNIKGSDLVNRQVGFEFWYGEGEWGDDTLFPGGCFFDDLSIEVSDKAIGGITYQEISPLFAGDYEMFGLTEDYENANLPEGWEYTKADERSADSLATATLLNGAEVASTDKINIKGKACNIIELNNIEYTASILTFKPEESSDWQIVKNNFYRLGLWVKTIDVDEDLGAEVCLMYAEDDSEVTCLDTINTDGEWQELSYVFQGAAFTEKEIYLQINFGSGDIYTPASHIKGKILVTAATWQSISYSEYSDTTSGDFVAKQALSDNISTSDTVSNGYFGLLNTTNFSSDKDTTGIFDKTTGTLIGAAIPSSWTATAATTSHLSTLVSGSEKFVPQSVTYQTEENEQGKKVISWTKVDDATSYYVFVGPVSVEDDECHVKTIDKVLVGRTTDETTFAMPNFEGETNNMKVYVQAYGDKGIGFQNGLSGFSTAIDYKLGSGDKVSAPETDDITSENHRDNYLNSEFGVIDYLTYAGAFKQNDLYNAESEPNSIYYKSSKSTGLLMMASKYYTNGGYKSSSKSISSGSYAKLSVWVKTTDSATASVTISNSSSVFAATSDTAFDMNPVTKVGNKDFIGFVNINTKGNWQQYSFYIKNESPSSATVYLELWFGNKYAEDTKTGKEGDEDRRTIHNGLTKGVVFFDDVTYTTFDDAEDFENAIQGKDANTAYKLKNFDNEYYANTTYFQVLDYTTDSFDESSESSYDDQGNTPGNYTHSVDTAANDYDSSLEDGEKQTMLYGVYNVNKLTDTSEVINTIMASDINSNGDMGDSEAFNASAVSSFIASNSFGKNVLVMANLNENGQSYYSSAISLSDDCYYKVTFFAKAWVPEGKYAEFRFVYGTDSTKYTSLRITSKDWAEYTFYVGNESGSSISSNKIYFYLGSDNDPDSEYTDPTDFTKGIAVIDNVSIVKLSAKNTDYTSALETYKSLSDDEKNAAKIAAYTFEEEKATDDDDDDDDEDDKKDEEETKSTISSQVWLLIASVVIGAVIVAVIVVFAVRKIKKKIKIAPTPVESKVPVNLAKPEEKKTITKKDIAPDDGYTD